MSRKSKRSLSKNGWLPNYHGAWAMISVPVLLGIIDGGFHWLHWLLLAFWWFGYFTFFAVSAWLHARFKPKFVPAVMTYSTLCALSLVALLFFAPFVLPWLIPLAPLCAISAWVTYQRQERSLLNNFITVIVACWMLPVAYVIGVDNAPPSSDLQNDWQGVWQSVCWTTLFVFGYFAGTVFYVKTNLRERKSNRYLLASIAFHSLFAVLAFALMRDNTISVWHAGLWVLLTGRSVFVPLYGRQKTLSPKTIGIGETVFSLLVFLTLL